MTSKKDSSNGARRGRFGPVRNFGDLAPVQSGARPNAADVRARGAADRLWKKVEEDLERIDRADIGNADDA